MATLSSVDHGLSPRRLMTSSSSSPPVQQWTLFPFYKKLYLILLALPLAIGTFLSLHQSLLVSSDSTRSPIPLLVEEKDGENSDLLSEDEEYDDELSPKIAWLLSFPNSGTSYTMTMVEQATNRSTASNYGIEVTDTKYPSVPVHVNHPEGPYWEGTSVARRLAPGKDRLKARIRDLPETFVLTKTHCGGRCVHCNATEYVVANTKTFLRACARTTARLGKNLRIEAIMDPTRVARVVHLIRNPFTNIVARFHLEGRNMMQRAIDSDAAESDEETAQAEESSAATGETPREPIVLPRNATGFATFCRTLDERYAPDEERVFDSKLFKLMQVVPCRAEFYKYVQWHNYVGKILASLGPDNPISPTTSSAEYNTHHVPTLTLYYEHFHSNIEVTTRRLLEFLDQEQYYDSSNEKLKIRAFRDLPTYDDHFSTAERQAAMQLMRTVATPWTLERIRHYLE
jgi:hypothetical protein